MRRSEECGGLVDVVSLVLGLHAWIHAAQRMPLRSLSRASYAIARRFGPPSLRPGKWPDRGARKPLKTTEAPGPPLGGFTRPWGTRARGVTAPTRPHRISSRPKLAETSASPVTVDRSRLLTHFRSPQVRERASEIVRRMRASETFPRGDVSIASSEPGPGRNLILRRTRWPCGARSCQRVNVRGRLRPPGVRTLILLHSPSLFSRLASLPRREATSRPTASDVLRSAGGHAEEADSLSR
ncbi:MAG: hypothetical protein JWM27_3840 [Gemmatimonadetes bacterium]|nr:hypothetical protein [Gemmatimonadota bacterium]